MHPFDSIIQNVMLLGSFRNQFHKNSMQEKCEDLRGKAFIPNRKAIVTSSLYFSRFNLIR